MPACMCAKPRCLSSAGEKAPWLTYRLATFSHRSSFPWQVATPRASPYSGETVFNDGSVNTLFSPAVCSKRRWSTGGPGRLQALSGSRRTAHVHPRTVILIHCHAGEKVILHRYCAAWYIHWNCNNHDTGVISVQSTWCNKFHWKSSWIGRVICVCHFKRKAAFWLQMTEATAVVLKLTVASFCFSSFLFLSLRSQNVHCCSSGEWICWSCPPDKHLWRPPPTRPLAFICEREDATCLHFTVANSQLNPLSSFQGDCNIGSDISAAGVGNTPWSIVAHSVVQLYRSVSLSVFLIMYWQKPGEWPPFTVCQRLHGQCGPKLQLYKTRVTTELGAEPSHMTHSHFTSSLSSTLVVLLSFVCTLHLCYHFSRKLRLQTEG